MKQLAVVVVKILIMQTQLISIFLVAQKQFHKKASLIFIFVLNQVIPLQSTKLLPIRSAVTIGFQ